MDLNEAPKRLSPLNEAADLETRAAKLEAEARALRESARTTEKAGGVAYDADGKSDRKRVGEAERAAVEKERMAREARAQAADYRRGVEDPRGTAPVGPSSPIESVLPDIGKESWRKPKPSPLVAALGLAVLVVALVLFAFRGEKPAPSLEGQRLAIGADGSVERDGKKYYRVVATDPSGDTGDETCAKAGKRCVGYTALTQAVCLAFHPGATPSEDFNGSKAGFYCDGAPQGGICGQEANTCHICPACNLNMECDTVIGDLYRETFVECE